jgi:hypothetical protein
MSRRERVGAVRDGGADQLDQVVTGTKLDRFDPSGPSLGIEVRGKRLSASRLGVPHHDRMSRSGSGGKWHVDPERGARCHRSQCEQCGGDDRFEENAADHECDDEPDDQQHAERSEHLARSTATQQSVPAHATRQQQQQRGDQSSRE